MATLRSRLPCYHQEFRRITTHASDRRNLSEENFVSIDVSHNLWRASIGPVVQLFDGNRIVLLQTAASEYAKAKRDPNAISDPQPEPYSFGQPDWSKAVIPSRQSCAPPDANHECIVFGFPFKRWRGLVHGKPMVVPQSVAWVAIDVQTGLIIQSHLNEQVESLNSTYNLPSGGYNADVNFVLQKQSYGADCPSIIFQLPSGLREVHELARWSVSRFNKEALGNPAANFSTVDIQGQPLSLAQFKGKTVLLTFFSTACDLCRLNDVSLDKLYAKYGSKNLAVVGISLYEARSTVEKFLTEHPRPYPTVLTSENPLPAAYSFTALPTYVVVAPDGTVAGATEGIQALGDVRRLLKKAGLETD